MPAGKYLTLELHRILLRAANAYHQQYYTWDQSKLIENDSHRDHWLLRRIRSVPGNSTAPFIISPMMHPTDHMSTENKNYMKINKKARIEKQINENPWLPMPWSDGFTFHWLDERPVLMIISVLTLWNGEKTRMLGPFLLWN